MPGSSNDHLRQPPTDEQDVIKQDMVIDTETLEVSGGREETGEGRIRARSTADGGRRDGGGSW